MTKRYSNLLCLLLAALVLLSACGKQEPTDFSSSPESGTSAEAPDLSAYDLLFSEEDSLTAWEEATEITFGEAGAQVAGSGASAAGSIVTISQAGDYLITGSCADGQILVEAAKTAQVHLIFDGLTLTCRSSAPLYIQQAGKVILTLAEGSRNALADTADYSAAAQEAGVDAVLYSKADLSCNGAGALELSANYRFGIVSKDDLIFTGGDYTIQSAADAIKGKDCIKVSGGTFRLTAEGDGLQAYNDAEAGRGFLYISGGTFEITAGQDALQAETLLRIDGGDFSLTTGSGAESVQNARADGWQGFFTTAGENGDAVSRKGIKAGLALYLTGGSFAIDSEDDALHTNGAAYLTGGSFSIATGDDGIHADGALAISGGEIQITQSYEGLEGKTVALSGGSLHITASDDGINAAGGSDSSGASGFGGKKDSFLSEAGTYITISGGYTVIDAGGDGIDSNGDLTVCGGTTLVWGPTDNANAALDYSGSGEIGGGILIAAGSSGMVQSLSATGEQGIFSCSGEALPAAGELVSLLDGAETLLSFTPAKNYEWLLISAPVITDGQSYHLYSGGTNSACNHDGYAEGGALSGGSLLLQQEASLGSSGGMGQGGMGKGDHKQDTPGGTAGEPSQKGQPQGSPQAESGQAPAGRP